MIEAVDPEKPRTPEEVRESLDAAREATVRSMERVRRDLLDELDWHTHFRRAPGKYLLAAIAVGFALGYRRRG